MSCLWQKCVANCTRRRSKRRKQRRNKLPFQQTNAIINLPPDRERDIYCRWVTALLWGEQCKCLFLCSLCFLTRNAAEEKKVFCATLRHWLLLVMYIDQLGVDNDDDDGRRTQFLSIFATFKVLDCVKKETGRSVPALSVISSFGTGCGVYIKREPAFTRKLSKSEGKFIKRWLQNRLRHWNNRH